MVADVILTSRPPFCCYARTRGFLVGVQFRSSSQRSADCCPVDFIDCDFKRRLNFEQYLDYARTLRPKYVVVPDVFKAEDMPEALERAELLRECVERVIIVPKFDGFNVPPRFMVGYSVPTRYGGTEVGLWDYQKNRIHLLGGSPQRQVQLVRYMDVASLDGNAYINAARFGLFWSAKTGRWDRSLVGRSATMEQLIRRSIDNIANYWRCDR